MGFVTRAAPWCALVAAVAVLPGVAGAQDAAVDRAPVVVTDEPVPDTSIRRARAETVLQAPMALVARRMLEYERYPDFMPRFRACRLLSRRGDGAMVYVELDLPRALGTRWFLEALTVVRARDRVEVRGVAVDGNIGHVETLAVLERVPGDPGRTRFAFSIYGVPAFSLPGSVVNPELREAALAVAEALRDRVEQPVAASARVDAPPAP